MENVLSSDLYFENQYTQQSENFESYTDRGLYLGKVHPQAIMALRSTATITLRWKTDRLDSPSPFWHNRFLIGSSVWNPDAIGTIGQPGYVPPQFEVQPPGVQYSERFQRLGAVTLGEQLGGPYFPLTLYTLANPINPVVAPFINDSTFVEGTFADPIQGEVYPTNHPGC